MLASNIGAGATIGATGRGYFDGISAWWWNGSSASACTSGSFNDHDDLVFAVGAAPGVNLTVAGIRRTSTYYYINFCNMGTTTSAGTFTLQLTNMNNNTSFETNSLYPFSVPAAGTCMETGGITCGLIGDTYCSLNIPVRGTVDFRSTIMETNEADNSLTVQF